MDAFVNAEGLRSRRPKLIKSMLKGLGCLTLVNRHNGISVLEAATELNLPKSTAYRVLETLCHGGYVIREMDGKYRTTSLVRTLSAGFDDEEWVLKVAHPELTALGRRLVWGVGISTPSGLWMHIRETTDRDSPLTLERWTAGTRLPLDRSGAGHLYLAYLSEREREKCLEALAHEPLRPESPLHRPKEFNAHLAMVRKRGFAIYQISAKEAAVSVPIVINGRMVACLGMHFVRRALSDAQIEAEFVPELTATVETIRARMIEGRFQFSQPAHGGTKSP